MIGLIFSALCGIALWGTFKGIKFAVAAIRDRDHRAENVLKSLAGFSIPGFLTYPWLLGRAIAAVACAGGVGLELGERVDLRSSGYEVDWLVAGGGHRELLEQGVDDLFHGRVAFLETSSYYPGQGLQRIAFAPDDSLHCVPFNEFASSWTLPRGKCLEVSPTRAAASRYRIETSPAFWRSDAFQRSLRFVARDGKHVVASYTERNIPGARFDLSMGVSRYTCPAPLSNGSYGQEFKLTSLALLEGEMPTGAAVAARSPPTPSCILPPLPEGTEVHQYQSKGGRVQTTLQIDRTGKLASENLVYVNRPDVPVVLVLRAVDPVIWRIRQTADSRIIAILAYSQESALGVTGAKIETPLLMTSAKGYSRMKNCDWAEFNGALRSVSGLPLASEVTGDRTYLHSQEVIPFLVGPKLPEDRYQEYDGIPASRYSLIDYSTQ